VKKLFATLVFAMLSFAVSAKEFFPTRDECEAAVRAGTAEFYSPRQRRPSKVAEAKASEKYLEEKYDAKVCGRAWVAYPMDGKGGSWQFIAQKEGTPWLAEKDSDGKALDRGLMDVCANEIGEIRAVQPAGNSSAAQRAGGTVPPGVLNGTERVINAAPPQTKKVVVFFSGDSYPAPAVVPWYYPNPIYPCYGCYGYGGGPVFVSSWGHHGGHHGFRSAPVGRVGAVTGGRTGR